MVFSLTGAVCGGGRRVPAGGRRRRLAGALVVLGCGAGAWAAVCLVPWCLGCGVSGACPALVPWCLAVLVPAGRGRRGMCPFGVLSDG